MDSPSSLPVRLVIPAFNESVRLPPFLEALLGALDEAGLGGRVEVVVVDDGSRAAETAAVVGAVDRLGARYRFLRPVLVLGENRGKGGAVYAGWDAAGGGTAWAAFVDADGAVEPDEVVRLLGFCGGEAAPATAYYAVRYPHAPGAVKRSPLRGVLGRVFALVVKLLFWFPLRDTQCGLKVVPMAAYRRVLGRLTEFHFCFDIDLTYHLEDDGVEIRAVPIHWHESPGSKVRLRSALSMLVSLWRLRWRVSPKRDRHPQHAADDAPARPTGKPPVSEDEVA